MGCLHAIGAWFVGDSTATAAWLALLIAIGTLLHEVVQGQRLPNPSKIEEWMAYNEFRQYCESQLDKGNLWNDCNKTLALQIKAPPLTDSDAFMEDDKLFSRRHPLANRIAALLHDGLKHGMKVHPLDAVLINASQLRDNNSGIVILDLDAGVNAQSSTADLHSSSTQRYQPRCNICSHGARYAHACYHGIPITHDDCHHNVVHLSIHLFEKASYVKTATGRRLVQARYPRALF